MQLLNAVVTSIVAASLLATPVAFGAEPAKPREMAPTTRDMDAFMKACDIDRDGMVSKAEMKAHMEKLFDRIDKRKTGKLDRMQTDELLRQLAKDSAGG